MQTRSRLFQIFPYALLIAAVTAAYANVYGNAFLLDDEFLILKNSFLRSPQTLGALLTSSSTAGSGGIDTFYRPLQGLIYFFVYQLAGLSTTAFHAVNVVLHAANACLVYALGRRLGFHKNATFIAALLWALHPVHTEAVTYMSATADPLYAFFCLLGACVLLPDFSGKRLAASCACFALALFSKETAIVFPLLAMLCLFLVSSERLNPRLYFKTWPLWLVAGLFLLLRLYVLHFNDLQFYKQPNVYSENIGVRLWTCLATLPSYLRVFLWPNDLHMDRLFPAFGNPFHLPVIIGFILVLAAGGVIIWTRGRRGLPLAWGLGWFALAHALHTGVLLPVNALFLEHWLYLPSVGLLLGTAQTVSDWAHPFNAPIAKRAVMTAMAIIAVVLGALTFRQNQVWRDPITFYETLLRYGSRSASTYNNLAMAYNDRGDNLRAIEYYRAAIAAYDIFPQSHHNLALALLALPDRPAHVSEAIKELERAIQMNPDFFQSYHALADLYASLGDNEKATAYRQKENEILQRLFPDLK
jgi:tetratricopeptide (TPR) repeat protein